MQSNRFFVWKKGVKGYFLMTGYYVSIIVVLISLIVVPFQLIDGKSEITAYLLIFAGIFVFIAFLFYQFSHEDFSIEYNRNKDTLLVTRGSQNFETKYFSEIKSASYQKIVVTSKSISSPDGMSKPVSSHFRINFIDKPFNIFLHFQTKQELFKTGNLLQELNKDMKIEDTVQKIFVIRDSIRHYW